MGENKMYQIKTYNVISNVGLAVFEKDKYEIN